MTTVDRTDLRDRLEAAFRKHVEIQSNKEDELERALDHLTLIAVNMLNDPPPNAVPARFRSIGRKATKKELDRVAKAAEKLATCLEVLHQPAIVALADRELNWREAARKIRRFADQVRGADVSKVPERIGHGRPEKLPANVVAGTVMTFFENLTGSRADLPAETPTGSRGLISLVRDVFGIIGLNANPKASVTAVLLERQKNRDSQAV
jgi:hypothetical protein